MDKLIKSTNKNVLVGLTDELKAIKVINEYDDNILVVTNSLYEANVFYKKLQNYTSEVYFFPMDDFLTSEALAISPELKYKRIETLYSCLEKNKKIVVTNLMGYLRFLPSAKLFEDSSIKLKVGNNYDINKIKEQIIDLGYEKETIITKTGDVSFRGYVIDIFTIDYQDPIRIEFWGDEISSIRFFDLDTQKSKEEILNTTIKSNTEFIIDSKIEFDVKHRELYKYGDVNSILDYFPSLKCIFINSNNIKTGYNLLFDEISNYKVSENLQDEKFMNEFYFPGNILCLNDFEDDMKLEDTEKIISQEILPFNGSLKDINNRLNNYLKNNKKVFICVENKFVANRIIEYLKNDNIIVSKKTDYINNKINLIIQKIDEGFEIDDYVVITEKELFNKKKSSEYKTKFKLGTKIRDITKLEIGDFVVHRMYGIGKYIGIKTLLKNGFKKDYLQISYLNDDKLYVPVEKIELINKYSSNDGIMPNLNSLGSTKWQKTKMKVQKRIESIAADLLKLYKEREKVVGIKFDEDTKEQYIFENNFEHKLTLDQERVVNEIKNDMEKSRPMDRLLCGDVGFGKTEVAFRAAFKAVMSGYQVGFLCPTTILSQQHFKNAIDRFADFGIRVEILNRFVSKKDTDKIIKDVKEGKIDILIGTHRILSDDIVFKNIGLLVIDEEQRFGVKHKEKIKVFKNNIDVLTLSATPIPRTLQMSMSGVRSLSLIETPPVNRYPIQTYVLGENNEVIKDAIYKELSRGGQVFILYNYVEGIEKKAEEIQNLVKEAKVEYAHGQMTKDKLENKMIRFTNNEFDVLLCTTIIETGIDIPNVNTLIIYDADRFGLSQLYQIRGRVGRSNKIAYAYFMYDKKKILTEIASKRLKVIKDFTELGSGFAIAMRDLSLRGAGDILGSEQAGFVDSIGVELFLNMLNEEISIQKGEKERKEEVMENPLVDVSTNIDDSYIDDVNLKIEIHKKIYEIDSYDKIVEVKNELEDRFGKITDELLIYMYEEWFEKLANGLNLKNIKQTKNSIEIVLPRELTKQIDGRKLFMDINDLSRKFRLSVNFECLVITLDLINLDKHFIYYLIDLMKILNNNKKN